MCYAKCQVEGGDRNKLISVFMGQRLSGILESKTEQELVPIGSASSLPLFVVIFGSEAPWIPLRKGGASQKEMKVSCGIFRLPRACHCSNSSHNLFRLILFFYILVVSPLQDSATVYFSSLFSSCWNTSVTKRQQKIVVNKLALESRIPGLNASFATYQLCDQCLSFLIHKMEI